MNKNENNLIEKSLDISIINDILEETSKKLINIILLLRFNKIKLDSINLTYDKNSLNPIININNSLLNQNDLSFDEYDVLTISKGKIKTFILDIFIEKKFILLERWNISYYEYNFNINKKYFINKLNSFIKSILNLICFLPNLSSFEPLNFQFYQNNKFSKFEFKNSIKSFVLNNSNLNNICLNLDYLNYIEIQKEIKNENSLKNINNNNKSKRKLTFEKKSSFEIISLTNLNIDNENIKNKNKKNKSKFRKLSYEQENNFLNSIKNIDDDLNELSNSEDSDEFEKKFNNNNINKEYYDEEDINDSNSTYKNLRAKNFDNSEFSKVHHDKKFSRIKTTDTMSNNNDEECEEFELNITTEDDNKNIFYNLLNQKEELKNILELYKNFKNRKKNIKLNINKLYHLIQNINYSK